MAIIIKEPVHHQEIDIGLEHRDYLLLKRIKEKCSGLDAIIVLRFMHKNCGLKQAKEFIDSIIVEENSNG